ncbi:phage minor head protein [Phaeobacter sp. PT47_59]|uniref:PBECR3 domain-containing polyvalent protein n=1 Tax=Phaeobacter sp. PT47_59 TaxID=3029979 RepID=UPI0023809C5A|nr:phage minor head protein [Phaeobacter sp. PT47_59]MDE4175792.1 phage minor head protein [Phaeobacter sp. PT47_59]
MTDQIAGIFRQPFTEQVAAFRLRLGDLVPTRAWDDLPGAAHDRGFAVAGAVKADLLADLAAAVDRAITEGTGFEAFKEDFHAAVARHGWTGWTGEGSEKGQAWRMRTIYRTNMRTSFMAGRLAQLRSGNFPFWVYRHGGSAEPRLQHLSWDGLILPSNHQFWPYAFPPNGFGCNCYVVGARSIAGAIRRGGKVGVKLREGWDAPLAETGAPAGIDEGWDHAPGSSVADLVQVMAQKTVNWPYSIARAFLDDFPAVQQDALSSSYRKLPSLMTDLRRYAKAVEEGRQVQPVRTMGRLPQVHRARVNELLGLDLENYHFTLDEPAVRHILASHGSTSEALRGQVPISAETYALLPTILDRPDLIEEAGQSRVGLPVLRFSRRIGQVTYSVALEVRGKKRRMLAVQTMWARRASEGSPT